MTNKEWFKEAKFGMMIHWGLYSLLAGEYNGQRYDYDDELVNGWDPVGEWIMPRYEIPISEYEKLAQAFNPVFFDADEWVALAKEAGNTKAVNVVLIGVMAKSTDIPYEVWIDTVKSTVPAKFLDINLKAFDLGYNYAKEKCRV